MGGKDIDRNSETVSQTRQVGARQRQALCRDFQIPHFWEILNINRVSLIDEIPGENLSCLCCSFILVPTLLSPTIYCCITAAADFVAVAGEICVLIIEAAALLKNLGKLRFI